MHSRHRGTMQAAWKVGRAAPPRDSDRHAMLLPSIDARGDVVRCRDAEEYEEESTDESLHLQHDVLGARDLARAAIRREAKRLVEEQPLVEGLASMVGDVRGGWVRPFWHCHPEPVAEIRNALIVRS